MKTVGSMLREARLQKKLSLEQVELDTKIRIKFLSAIESDNYHDLPSVSYAKGFVRNYGAYLGLDSNTVMAFFRRETKDVTRASLLPKKSEDMNKTLFQLTPGKFVLLLIALFFAVFVSYLGVQYLSIRMPPNVTLESPKDNESVTVRRIDIYGKTDPDATVTVNGITVVVRSDGRFFDQVTLETGSNDVTVIGISRYGKSATIKRKVTYIEEKQ